ncbi:MAG TPA: hypothetical protein VMA09_00230 [Candidatus Binataceae bacterium]|nr:hypothetical protein [Candidatus Binataceae bacterium]
MTIDEMRKALQEPLFDSSIIRHGFAPFLRDYDIVAEINKYQFLYRFTHCTSVAVVTSVTDRCWQESWEDIYTDYGAWSQAGAPDGKVWGVRCLLAYPGASYVDESAPAREWAARLGKPMHEVRIETNGHTLDLIFHDLSVRELSERDEEWITTRANT